MHSRVPLRVIGASLMALSATCGLTACASSARAVGESMIAEGRAEVTSPRGASPVATGATVVVERKTQVTIRVNTAKLTVHCEDDTASVTIQGRNGDVRIDSDCGKTVVLGTRNLVSLQNVRGLEVGGMDNVIDYVGTGTATPHVGGVDNTIVQR